MAKSSTLRLPATAAATWRNIDTNMNPLQAARFAIRTRLSGIGDAELYPGTCVHGVEPVTRGQRLASFFWIESMVRSDEQRRLLFDLDMNLMRLREAQGESESAVALSGTYHNLLRMWADT